MRRRKLKNGKSPDADSYLEQILREAALRPGTVTVAGVYHERGCGIFRGGPCTCAPDIVIAQPERKTV